MDVVTRWRPQAAFAATAILTLARVAGAQTASRPSVALTVGAYIPIANLPYGNMALLCADNGNGQCADVWRKGNPAVALGVHVTGWFNNRTGFEASALYAPSSTSFMSKDNRSAGRIVLASTRAAIRPGPEEATVSGVLLAGPMLAYRGLTYGHELSFGGAVGIGLDLRPRGPCRFRIQADGYFYSASEPGDHKLQQDAVISLSIGASGNRGQGQARAK